MIPQSPQPLLPTHPAVLDATGTPAPERHLDHPLLVVRIHPDGERRTFFGYAGRISAEGLTIAATRPRDAGETFDLEFHLSAPLDGPVRCRCEVAWKRDWARGRSPGMGLRFLDLPDEVATKLALWIERESRRPTYRADAVA